jgi:hypothetical protein
MGAAGFVALGLLMLMGLPLLTCFYAKQLGRSQKKWFLIGVLLPGIATIILSFLPDLSEENEKGSKM